MADEVRADPGSYEQGTPAPNESGATAEERLAASLLPQEREQPDPALQLSVSRVGAGGITLVAVVCAIIIAVVFWGLNTPAPNAQVVGTPHSTSHANPSGRG
jgi:hypothetical protein